jgi:hypothetical protein
MRASMETLYSDLIPEEFLIKLTDAVSDVVDIVDVLFNSFGGLSTALLLISNIVLTKFGPSITNGINSGIDSISKLSINIGSLAGRIFSAKKETTDLSSEISKINDGSLKNAKDQIGYFNEKLKDGASETLKLSQSMNASALNAGNLTTAFEGYLKDTSQVYNL